MIAVVAGVALLAVLTYAARAVGVPRGRTAEEAPGWSRAVTLATAALLGAVVATAMLFDGQAAAGWARAIGVGAGMIAALLRAPLLVVIAIAVVTTAALRLLGLP